MFIFYVSTVNNEYQARQLPGTGKICSPSAELRIPVKIFLFVHPLGKGFGHLVSVVVIVLAVERLTDIDPDLPALKAV